MTTTDLHSTQGPWFVDKNGGCYEIVRSPVNGVAVGLAHELADAVLMSAAPDMLNALIEVQEIASNMPDADKRELIRDALSKAFGKIYQEAS